MLDKSASKTQVHAQTASVFVSAPEQPAAPSGDSQVSMTSYQKAINSVLEKPTAAIAPEGTVEPEILT